MVAGTSERTISSWVILVRELRKRTVEPVFHASFVMYFCVAVLLVGGLGVWFEMHSYLFYVPTPEHPLPSSASLRIAVVTFFPALAGSSCLQLIWAEDHHKSLRAFAITALAALTAVVLAIAPSSVSDSAALSTGVVASIIALWTWWIANAKQRDLLDIDAATGKKDTEGDLPGNLDEFKV